ncbi:MAG: sigma 54-interacting transcriptional regulator [Myxococcota bacterium]
MQRTGPLGDPSLSREHLRLVVVERQLHVELLGRIPLLVNGRPLAQGPLRVGDLLEVGDRLLLLVGTRPADLGGTAPAAHPFGEADALGIVGETPAAWALREQIAFAAPRHVHVLVTGASGTGKELVARGLHHGSPGRRRAELVSRNAATIPESLADAELFGNLQGYPNPGMAARPGLIGHADRSTLYLDEFGELSTEVQARLLRVLDTGEYTRLGEARPRTADIRLVAATNRDPALLKHDVRARLKLEIRVPSLSERIEDVPLIAAHLLRGIARDDPALAGRIFEGDARHPQITMALLRQLLTHPYTTHVRELEALLWRSVAAAEHGPLDEVAPSEPPPPSAPRAQRGPTDPGALDPAHVQQVLDRHGGFQERAWRELGLANRHVLARFVTRHGLRTRVRAPARSARAPSGPSEPSEADTDEVEARPGAEVALSPPRGTEDT